MRESKREYSIFIHNLPKSLDRFGLAGIFQKVGLVSDVSQSNMGLKAEEDLVL